VTVLLWGRPPSAGVSEGIEGRRAEGLTCALAQGFRRGGTQLAEPRGVPAVLRGVLSLVLNIPQAPIGFASILWFDLNSALGSSRRRK
jgi:hypothetical protein